MNSRHPRQLHSTHMNPRMPVNSRMCNELFLTQLFSFGNVSVTPRLQYYP
jgi:hypothetical protein